MKTPTRFRKHRGGQEDAQLTDSFVIGAVLELFEKVSKQGPTSLTASENKNLNTYLAFLASKKDASGKSIMAEAIREVTKDVRTEKPKTADQVESILSDEIAETTAMIKGGVGEDGRRRMNEVPPLPEEQKIPQGLTLVGVLQTLAVGTLLYFAGTNLSSESTSGLVARRENIVARQVIRNVGRNEVCLDFDPKYSPTYRFMGMLDVNPAKTAAHEACLITTTAGMDELTAATRDFYQACEAQGVNPDDIEGPPLEVSREDAKWQVSPPFVPGDKPSQLKREAASPSTSNLKVENQTPLAAIEFAPTPSPPPEKPSRLANFFPHPGVSGFGGKRDKRKTKKRVIKKRRVTRRKPTFSY